MNKATIKARLGIEDRKEQECDDNICEMEERREESLWNALSSFRF